MMYSFWKFNPKRTFNIEQIENVNNEKALSLLLSAGKSSIILIPRRDNHTNASS